MKKMRIASGAIIGLALLFIIGAMTAAAAGPIGTGPKNVLNLDNLRHTVAANSTTWFRFGFTDNEVGAESITRLRMVAGNKNGLSFELWGPDAATGAANTKSMGQGAPYAVDCSTGLASAQGGCESNDLIWSGTLEANGTYFVSVDNTNLFSARVLLTIEGQGLNLNPQAIPVTGTSLQPEESATILENMDNPANSLTIDDQSHNLASKSAVWYRFDYGGIDNSDRPIKIIRLLNGNNSGVKFEIFAGTDLNDWWDKEPIGRGSAYEVSCDNGEPAANTGCMSRDLLWSGAFGGNGTYYVRVYNDNTQPTLFTLTIQ